MWRNYTGCNCDILRLVVSNLLSLNWTRSIVFFILFYTSNKFFPKNNFPHKFYCHIKLNISSKVKLKISFAKLSIIVNGIWSRNLDTTKTKKKLLFSVRTHWKTVILNTIIHFWIFQWWIHWIQKWIEKIFAFAALLIVKFWEKHFFADKRI